MKQCASVQRPNTSSPQPASEADEDDNEDEAWEELYDAMRLLMKNRAPADSVMELKIINVLL